MKAMIAILGTAALSLAATAAAAQSGATTTAPAGTPATTQPAPGAAPAPQGAEPAAPAVMTSTYGTGSAGTAARTGAGSKPNGGAAAADPARTERDIDRGGKSPR